MRNKVLLIFIIFLLGISQGTQATNIVAPEQYEEPSVSITESIDGPHYTKGKNKKHPNFTGRFLKNNIIPTQFREFGTDYCPDTPSHSFVVVYKKPNKLFISIELDINRTTLPLFKLFNNYRI